jgi:hypothetical protein
MSTHCVGGRISGWRRKQNIEGRKNGRAKKELGEGRGEGSVEGGVREWGIIEFWNGWRDKNKIIEKCNR